MWDPKTRKNATKVVKRVRAALVSVRVKKRQDADQQASKSKIFSLSVGRTDFIRIEDIDMMRCRQDRQDKMKILEES